MQLWYPKVLSEDNTLDRIVAGASCSRFGDGELRLALGGSAAAQRADPRLARDLKEILYKSGKALVCIPNSRSKSPKTKNWEKYTLTKFTSLFGLGEYGSSFITRPDSAPWIDRPDYWEKIRSLWKDKDVTLVIGSERSLTQARMPEARSIRIIRGEYRDSYDRIDAIREEIGRPPHAVLLCLGPTATVLACQLAAEGVWAIDLGHVGLTMGRKQRGLYYAPNGECLPGAEISKIWADGNPEKISINLGVQPRDWYFYMEGKSV